MVKIKNQATEDIINELRRLKGKTNIKFYLMVSV